MTSQGTRTRLEDLIREKFGEITPAVLKMVAEDAKVSYTTIARFLLYRGEAQTQTIRGRTVRALGRVLDVRPEWLIDGQGDRQLAFWPRLDPPSADSLADVDGDLEDLNAVFRCVTRLPGAIGRIRVCRATVSACLDAASREGMAIDGEAYSALVRLDARLRHLQALGRSA